MNFVNQTVLNSLKYGCNPHQKEAALYVRKNGNNISEPPFTVLNGSLGYINTLDAINSWKLVSEIKESIGSPAATSFKHVSPAGVALGTSVCESSTDELTWLFSNP